jgi:hypothetical protein
MRGLVPGTAAGAANCGGATAGGGVTLTSCIGPDAGLGDKMEVGMMVGPMAPNASGDGGTAVLATPTAAGIGTGGGVGGYKSGEGTGLGAGAAAPACSLAPQPRQNL